MVNATQVEVTGTLQPDGTLVLDQKPNLPPGRVRVVVQLAPEPGRPAINWLEHLQRIRAEREADGYPFMNEEEVAAYVDWLREDDDRIAEAYRQSQDEQPS